MNNEQQKAKELAELLTAFAEGKQLQFEGACKGFWVDYAKHVTVNAICTQANITRIKPETKRVPLTMQDLIDRELKKETMMIINKDGFYTPISFNSKHVYIYNTPFNYSELMNYTFLDNTPFYKEVEDE